VSTDFLYKGIKFSEGIIEFRATFHIVVVMIHTSQVNKSWGSERVIIIVLLFV
jgi:hypothetical protein